MPLFVPVFLPMLGALALVALRRHRPLRDAVLVSVGILNLLVLTVIFLGRSSGEVQMLAEIIPGLSLAFHVEPLGLVFAMTSGVLWPLTSIYAISYLRAGGDPHQTRFHALFCVAIGSATGIALAENLFTLFLFYETLTLSTWPLVTHSRTREAVLAGRVYLGVLLLTSLMLLLLAILLVGNFGESLSFTPGGVLGDISPGLSALLLVLFTFGIGKTAIMPFHRWLPNAMVAPAPVSALLHAVAVVKAGVFTILKVCVYIFGFDLMNDIGLRDALMWIAALTILLASAIAMRQDDIKARLAYSTVSQLSYIVLGALMANAYALVGSAMHITMHAFGKITLFFCAGAIMVFSGRKYVSEMDGLGRSMPWTFGAFLVASLSIAGLPPSGGLWSKWYLALGALELDQAALLALLMISSLLNVYYLVSIPVRAFFLPPKAGEAGPLENRPAMIVPLVVTAAVSFLLFFAAGELQHLLAGLTREVAS